MQRARHGQQSRPSHRSAAILGSAARRPRTVAMIAVAAVGLAVAFWLPTRNDSASASENGQRAWYSWRHDGNRDNHDWRHRQRPPWGAEPSGIPSVTPPSDPTTTEPPTTEPPTTETPTTEPPETEPPTAEPTTPPTTEPTATPPTTPPTTAPAAKAWAAYTIYGPGQRVTSGGTTYEVLAAHTSLPGWEPPKVPALFKVVS